MAVRGNSRQNDSIAAAVAYRRCKAACDAVEAHIAQHGRDGLVTLCATYAGETATIKTSVLMSVNRLCGREARDECREVLQCF
jgi:hypothetical protein